MIPALSAQNSIGHILLNQTPGPYSQDLDIDPIHPNDETEITTNATIENLFAYRFHRAELDVGGVVQLRNRTNGVITATSEYLKLE